MWHAASGGEDGLTVQVGQNAAVLSVAALNQQGDVIGFNAHNLEDGHPGRCHAMPGWEDKLSRVRVYDLDRQLSWWPWKEPKPMTDAEREKAPALAIIAYVDELERRERLDEMFEAHVF